MGRTFPQFVGPKYPNYVRIYSLISQLTHVGHQTLEHHPTFSDVLREGRRFPERRGHRCGSGVQGLARRPARLAEIDEVVVDRVFEPVELRFMRFISSVVGGLKRSTAEIHHIRRWVGEQQSRYIMLV